MKYIFLLLIVYFTISTCFAQLHELTVVKPASANLWNRFPLNQVRLIEGSPFYEAMQISQDYLIGMDIERMLNGKRRQAGIPEKQQYPGSSQPAGTRPGDADHYLSGISLMYAQTGDKRFLNRVDYIIGELATINEKINSRIKANDTTYKRPFQEGWKKILNGELRLAAPDELGYPWGGTTGNNWYGVHKKLASYRDAFIYCNNKTALQLWISEAEEIVAFVSVVNPDLFDGMLDVEHGGMNEVFADLYALTADYRYMNISKKFNHQKVILNIADGKDILNGRHANMQVPTFVGTARQYHLTGDEVSRKATANFLDFIYRNHMSVIGGNSCYERFGRPGETTKRLGFTGNETCNTYNMLKVALNFFESTGDVKHMDYFERALYNHILASQDPKTGGVTYYTTLMPGHFKSYSKGYDLTGVWCCVGTGMENHSKYGEAIYFHNHKDLYVNLFISSRLEWKEKGTTITMETKFPESDIVTLKITENKFFNGQIYLRYPAWLKQSPKVWINNEEVSDFIMEAQYIRLHSNWKKSDVIKIEMPQDLHLEPAKDDPFLVAVLRGPLVMAGELGKDRMPGSDLVRQAHFQYRNWIPPTDDIPVLIVNKVNPSGWIVPVDLDSLKYKIRNAAVLSGNKTDLTMIPYYRMHHQRFTVYWKMYTPDELEMRRAVISDEINPANPMDEKAHNLKGENTDTATQKDDRDFWERNRIGRMAKNGGWFSYDLTFKNNKIRKYLVVTYWGGANERNVFDVLINDKLLKHESIGNRHPLTFYEEVYILPDSIIEGKEKLTVQFRSQKGFDAGIVYGLKITSNPRRFPNYLFY